MLDPDLLRAPPDWLQGRLAARGYQLDLAKLHDFDQKRRKQQAEAEDLRARRNRLAKQTGAALKKGAPADELKSESAQLGN